MTEKQTDLEGLFGQIHSELANTMLTKLKAIHADSEETIPASFIKEIREFLKDNSINLDAYEQTKSPILELAKILPFEIAEESSNNR